MTTDTNPDALASVEQVDRKAAAKVARRILVAFPHSFMPDFSERIVEGVWDNHWFVQAFARHRLAYASRVSTPAGEMERVFDVLWPLQDWNGEEAVCRAAASAVVAVLSASPQDAAERMREAAAGVAQRFADDLPCEGSESVTAEIIADRIRALPSPAVPADVARPALDRDTVARAVAEAHLWPGAYGQMGEPERDWTLAKADAIIAAIGKGEE